MSTKMNATARDAAPPPSAGAATPPGSAPIAAAPRPPVEVIGIDHVYLAVRSLPTAERFYDEVLVGVLGFRKNTFALAGDPHVQYYNRHLGIVIRPAAAPAAAAQMGGPGLHHLCLRVDSAADVERVAEALTARGVLATPARLYPEYAPDYVATHFTDPEGTRLEVTNYRAERRRRHDHWDELA